MIAEICVAAVSVGATVYAYRHVQTIKNDVAKVHAAVVAAVDKAEAGVKAEVAKALADLKKYL